MNINKTIMIAVLSGAVGVAATAQQRTTPGGPAHSTQNQLSHTSEAGLMQKINLVKKDAVDKDLTASKVIGEDVYGVDGEKIGEIHDLKFAGQQFNQLRQQFHAANGDEWIDESADSLEKAGDRVADSVERAGERTADAIDRTLDDSADNRNRTGDATAERVDRASERTADGIDRTTYRAGQELDQTERGSDRWSNTGTTQNAELLAIVQTGGVLGLGADYFSVPLGQLRYNAEEERFTLGITQAQLEQIREGKADTSVSPSASR
jgi:hypothetical protein